MNPKLEALRAAATELLLLSAEATYLTRTLGEDDLDDMEGPAGNLLDLLGEETEEGSLVWAVAQLADARDALYARD